MLRRNNKLLPRTSILVSFALACLSSSAQAATVTHGPASGLAIRSPSGDTFTGTSVPLNLRLGSNVDPASVDIHLNGQRIDANDLTLGIGDRRCGSEPRAIAPAGRGKSVGINALCDSGAVLLQGKLTPAEGLLASVSAP